MLIDWWVPLRPSIALLLTSWRFQEDSVILWKAVCSNKLLAKVELILFMNKCDILAALKPPADKISAQRLNDPYIAQKCELVCAEGRSALVTAEQSLGASLALYTVNTSHSCGSSMRT